MHSYIILHLQSPPHLGIWKYADKQMVMNWNLSNALWIQVPYHSEPIEMHKLLSTMASILSICFLFSFKTCA